MKINTIQNYNYLNNLNSLKQPTNNTKYLEQKSEAEYCKYSSDNLKANYLVNFKGNINVELSSTSNIGTLNSETYFFRDPKTDEIVQDYILDNFSDESEINVVSGACSTGEEAKSYAMMLDSLGDKLHIFGFDISDSAIQQANNSRTKLLLAENFSELLDIAILSSNDSERFIIDDSIPLNPYLQKCKEKFHTYYDKSGDAYKIPINPEAQKQLDDLNELMANQEKYEEAKNEYNKAFSDAKNNLPQEGIKDIFAMIESGPSFEEIMNLNRKLLEEQSKMFYTFQDYNAKKGSFENCHFEQGDLLNLAEMYKPNSINVLLYRNALYHTLCTGDNSYRLMCEDAQEKMDDIARQMNKVVKNQGLVVLGEDEWVQGINSKVIEASMQNNGFKKLIHNGEEIDNIWVKIVDCA